MMTIAVIIPVYNEEKYIDRCLGALINQKPQADEIIIVNNNCTDNTIAIAKKYPVTVVDEIKQGMIPARNAGFNSAKSDILARIDADTVVLPDWIAKIKNDFGRDKNIAGVAGPMYAYDFPFQKIVSFIHRLLYFEMLSKIHHHYLLFGSNMAITRTVWQKIKNNICLDDGLVHEDVDLSINVNRYGRIYFDPELYVQISFRTVRQPKRLMKYIKKYLSQLKSI